MVAATRWPQMLLTPRSRDGTPDMTGAAKVWRCRVEARKGARCDQLPKQVHVLCTEYPGSTSAAGEAVRLSAQHCTRTALLLVLLHSTSDGPSLYVQVPYITTRVQMRSGVVALQMIFLDFSLGALLVLYCMYLVM